MTIEQQAQIKEALEAAKKIAIESSDHHNVKDLMLTHDLAVAIPDQIDRALGHLSSQAPGNLSEEEIERVAKEDAQSGFYSTSADGRMPDFREVHRQIVGRVLRRYARDHYLSGWVAVSIPPKFQKYYWVLLDKIPMWGTTDADRVMMYWYRGDGQWADQHGDDLMDISDHITHYADPVPPAPLP